MSTLRKTFLFSEEAGQKYAARVDAGGLGCVAESYVNGPTDIMFITVESTLERDLVQLVRLANNMGSTGETQTEQETAAQTKVDVARKEREVRRQETDKKREQEAEKATQARQQGVDRQRAGTDKAGENEKARTDRLQKQTDAKKEAGERVRDSDQRRRDQVQRQKEREQEREDELDGGEGDPEGLAKTVATAAAKGVEAALSKSKGKKSDDKEKEEKKEQMLSFGQYLEQAPTNFAGQGTKIAGLGGDEPIVRGQAQRMKDCSKCKGIGCPACTPTAFIRRAAIVAENIMRQLKAKRIASEVMEQVGSGGGNGGGNGGGGNGSGNGNGGNGNGNGNGNDTVTHLRGHGASRTCPAGQVWDAAKQKCVKRLQTESISSRVRPPNRADMQVGVFIKGLKNKGHKKFALAFAKSAGRKMPSPSKFGISDDDAAGLRSSIDRIQNDFAEAVENLDIPAEPTTMTYAGSPVFKVSPEVFANCAGGRAKWARWSKVLNLEDEGQAAIRTYANKYPSRPIVLQCDETGDMKFLRFNRKGGGGNRRRRKHALPTPTDGSTGQIVFDADTEQMAEASARITASAAANTLRKRGHKLKANEIFSLAKTNKIGRILRSPALGLVFTNDEVDKLDKILSEGVPASLTEGAAEDMIKFLSGHLKRGKNPSRPSARELKGIITSADSGIEILDYVNTFFAFSEREWSFFVDGKRNRELAGSRKPADKEKLLKAVLKKIQ